MIIENPQTISGLRALQSAAPIPTAPVVIRSETQALDVIANGPPYVVVGNRHGLTSDMQQNVDIIPTLARSNVTVIGLESSPRNNQIYSQIQDRVRDGATLQKVQVMLAAHMQQNNIQYTAGVESGVSLQSEAAILFDATRHNIRVVGIDARQDDGRYANPYQLDTQTAANASAVLATQPQGSRMAIFYGENHLSPAFNTFIPATGPNGAIRLGQALDTYGGATLISPSLSNIYGAEGVMRLDGDAFARDRRDRDNRDGRPVITIVPAAP
jgi:hypothetical protein